MAEVVPVFNPVTRRWRTALADYDEPTLQAIADFLTRAADALDTEADKLRTKATVGVIRSWSTSPATPSSTRRVP